MLFVQWMRAELEYFCLAAYKGDFIDQLAHLSFYDENNLVREWIEYGRSNRAPVLDEDDDDGDIPLPSILSEIK